jgi:hypothetical protein
MGSQPTIVHYDFADIRYSSFYSTGFLLNAAHYGYRFVISRKPPPLLDDPAIAASWGKDMTQRCRLLYRFTSDSEDYYFCIDTLDHNRNYNLPLLQNVEMYFKVNYDLDCIPRDREVVAHIDRIKPVLPFFPLRGNWRLGRIPRLWPSRTMAWDHRAAVRRIIDAPRVPSVETLRTLRGSSECCDVFFVSVYYPEEQHASAMEFRYELMQELDSQGFRRSLYGFATRTELPEPFNEYAIGWFSFRNYLRTLAGARLAIYVRGLLDCISFKFGEYLCLGVPVVGQTIANNRERLVGLPYLNEQFALEEPRDIALKAAVLLGQGDKRRALGESNARVFDTMLSPESATADVLEALGTHRRRN